MRVDVHFYCGVPMPDAGADGPDPVDRRYGNDAVIECYRNLEHWAQTAEGYGFDTMWLTEHHFQHEGYEVVPNLILMGMHLASLTERLRFGQAFNVVPQWHPLRLAEDYATADILTGGRMVFGVGRGTVPREMETLGGVVASGDNDMSASRDAVNREVFEEAMDVIRLAWSQERFSYTGKHFVFPPPGIPDRGGTVTDLTLVPRPVHSTEIFQPATSPPTIDFVARVGHTAIFAGGPLERTEQGWRRFDEVAAEHGRALGPGEGRALHLNCHVGRTTAQAIDGVRAGHDEYVKFLRPYGRFSHYRPDAPFDHAPTVEETADVGHMLIGSIEEVANRIGTIRDRLSLRHLLLFLDFPGLDRGAIDDQMALLSEEVLPRVGIELTQ